MRSWRATKNLLAVSANAMETGINVFQTLDTTMMVDIGDVINKDPRREDNSDEQTGKEEPDLIYDLGNLSGLQLNFKKMQPQHAAFVLAYALGGVSTAAAGTGYEHTVTPITAEVDADRSNPSFTAAQRLGDTIVKQRFASQFIDSFNMTFAADDWVKLTAQAKGTGKVEESVVEEEITAAKNATTLNLAANGVQGADDAERLQNVQQILVELDSGVWTAVAFSAVSAATPAVITITAPGATTDNVTYKVLYIPTESAWMTFPSRVTETPLRVAQTTLTLGGTWTGSAFSGGRQLTSELKSLEWVFNNNSEITFVPGAGDAYAARQFRPARTQAVKLTREMRDYMLQNHIDKNDTFGLRVLAEGAVYDSPHKYQVEVIFPMLGVLTAPISVDNKIVAEAGDLKVLQHDTYGSVIAKVKNKVSAYAA